MDPLAASADGRRRREQLEQLIGRDKAKTGGGARVMIGCKLPASFRVSGASIATSSAS